MPTVQLFATCLGDLVFPDAVADAEALLREAGFEVEFPTAQVCCGQPAFNAGHRTAARRVGRTFARAFSRTAPVVMPSGSCAAMVSQCLPGAARRGAVGRLGAVGVPRGRRASSRAGGTRGGPSPTTTPATCCASCGSPTSRAGCSRRRARRSRRCRAPTSAAASAARSRCASRRSRWRWPTRSWRAPREPRRSSPPIPGCITHLRGRSEKTGGPRVVHLATALARGLG